MKEYHVIMTKRRALERIDVYSRTATATVLSKLSTLAEHIKAERDEVLFYLPQQFETYSFHSVDEEASYFCKELAHGSNCCAVAYNI